MRKKQGHAIRRCAGARPCPSLRGPHVESATERAAFEAKERNLKNRKEDEIS